MHYSAWKLSRLLSPKPAPRQFMTSSISPCARPSLLLPANNTMHSIRRPTDQYDLVSLFYANGRNFLCNVESVMRSRPRFWSLSAETKCHSSDILVPFEYHFVLCRPSCLGGSAVRRRTRDRKVAGSTPGRPLSSQRHS